jgi:cell division protein FtsX
MRITGTWMALLAAVVGLLASGCGGSGQASVEETTTDAGHRAQLVNAGLRPPTTCYLTVYMTDTSTRAQRRQLQTLMLESESVESVAFVSKQLALERLKRTRPQDARRMRLNLFPDTFEVIPRTHLDLYSLISGFARGVPGVANVRVAPSCDVTP